MAEIPIQQKRGGSKLPFIIIGIIALALILWLLLGRKSDDNAAPAGADTTKTSSIITSEHGAAFALSVTSADWRS